MKNSNLFSLLLLLFCGIGYGSAFIANKIVANEGLPVTAYLFWLSVLGTIIVIPLTFFFGLKFPGNFRSIVHFPISATFGMLIPFAVLYSIATKLPAGVLTLTLTLAPAFTYFLSFLFRIEPFRWLSIVAICSGALGVLLIVLPETSVPGKNASYWLLFGLLAPIAAATNNLVVALFRPPDSHSLVLVGSVMLSATLIMFPIMLSLDGFVMFWTYGSEAVMGVIWAATVHTLGYFGLYEVIRRLGPVFFSQIVYVIIFAGILWAYIYFDEEPSAWVWGAIVFMVGGLICANYAAVQSKQLTQNKK